MKKVNESKPHIKVDASKYSIKVLACVVSNTALFPTAQRLSFEKEGWEKQKPNSLCFVTTSFRAGASLANPEQSLFPSTRRGWPPQQPLALS